MEVEKKQIQLNVERQRMDMLKLFAITSAHRMANDVGTIPVAAKEIERLINAEEPDRDAILMYARRIDVDARRLMDQAQKVRKPIAVHDPQAVNVHETIQRALNGTETRFPEIRLSVDLTASQAICKANFLMLTDVFKNLIDNAIEAMSGKGSLTISSEIIDQNGENKIRINVTDTGPGIQPRHQEHLFDPFFTTKEGKGMGIGLFWTKNFLEQDVVRGSLDYQTEVGKGTTFIITLPLADSK
jgi:two-component system NtrC family sensor kinase